MRSQQGQRCGIIVEDRNLSDSFATWRDMSGLDHEDFLPFSCRCIPQHSIGSNCHHLFLKRLKTDISQNAKFPAPLLGAAVGRRYRNLY